MIASGVRRMAAERTGLVARITKRLEADPDADVSVLLERVSHLSRCLHLLRDEIDRRSARRRVWLLAGLAIVVIALTVFSLYARPCTGKARLDLEVAEFTARIGRPGFPVEIVPGLAARRVTIDAAGSVELRGRTYGSVDRLSARSTDSRPLTIVSVTAPGTSTWWFDASALPRLALRITPPESGAVSVELRLPSGTAVDAELPAEARAAFAASLARPREGWARVAGGAGMPVALTVDLAAGAPDGAGSSRLRGVAGQQMTGLDLLEAPSSLGGRTQALSHVLAGRCSFPDVDDPGVELAAHEPLTATGWHGTALGLQLGRRGLELGWEGEASDLTRGFAPSRQRLLPVYFHRWVGRSPRAYVSLILLYVTFIPLSLLLSGAKRLNDSMRSLELEAVTT